METMRSHDWRGVAHFPYVGSRPKRRDAKFPSLWVDEGNVEHYLIKRIPMRLPCCEGQLDCDVRFRSEDWLLRRRDHGHSCPKQQGEERLIPRFLKFSFFRHTNYFG